MLKPRTFLNTSNSPSTTSTKSQNSKKKGRKEKAKNLRVQGLEWTEIGPLVQSEKETVVTQVMNSVLNQANLKSLRL